MLPSSRGVPFSVDVTRLWVDVRETFSGVEESILIDRFVIDAVATRARHAERMAEATAYPTKTRNSRWEPTL